MTRGSEPPGGRTLDPLRRGASSRAGPERLSAPRGYPVTDPALDLSSDSVTLPTEEMWAAMRAVGSPSGRSGTSCHLAVELGDQVAALAGKEAGLYAPTGTVANLLALMAHTRPGDQIVLESSSHIVWCEGRAYASICGVTSRAVEGSGGHWAPVELERAICESMLGHRPMTSVVCLETSHNVAGGTVLRQQEIRALADVAHANGAAVHVDGARIWNACAALGTRLSSLVARADSVTLNLNKGLSAPQGAVLVGSGALIGRAEQCMTQLGVRRFLQDDIGAAAGLVALRDWESRVTEDNRRAARLAGALNEVEGLDIDMDTVETNLVRATVTHPRTDGPDLVRSLTEGGVGISSYGGNAIRFVTHRHVTDESVERASDAVSAVLEGAPYPQ